jgi:hypothetical protein
MVGSSGKLPVPLQTEASTVPGSRLLPPLAKQAAPSFKPD